MLNSARVFVFFCGVWPLQNTQIICFLPNIYVYTFVCVNIENDLCQGIFFLNQTCTFYAIVDDEDLAEIWPGQDDTTAMRSKELVIEIENLTWKWIESFLL